MNITKNQIDDLNFEVVLKIEAADYAEAERKKLSGLRQKAELKGFRKGMAPASLIQRLYGGQVLYDCVNELVGKNLNDFIAENKIRIVGEPLPSENQPQLEWSSGKDFEFHFDLAQTPEVTFTVSKDDKLPFYQINVTKDAKAAMKKSLLNQYGAMQEAEAAGEEDYIVADLDNGSHKVEGAYISLRSVAEGSRSQFLARKAGDEFTVDVNAAFENETDRAAMLKLAKDKLAGIDPNFKVTVINVKTYVPAEDTQEGWDKIFGEGVVKSAEEFDEKIAERLTGEYLQQANYRFSKDAREYFLKKADIQLPEAFLRRWLIYVNEGKYTPEQVDAEFEAFLADFRWQLTRGHILRLFDLKVEEKDIEEAARGYAAYQYAMYGMGNVPADLLDDAAKHMLSDENQRRRLEEQVEDNKAFQAIRENVTLQNKKISEDKFRELK